MKRIIKPWGFEEILEVNKKYMVKRLFMKKNHRCSLQYHKFKLETVICLSGTLLVKLEKKNIILKQGDTLTIKNKKLHRMQALTNRVYYLECSTPHLDDVIRVKDDYIR